MRVFPGELDHVKQTFQARVSFVGNTDIGPELDVAGVEPKGTFSVLRSNAHSAQNVKIRNIAKTSDQMRYVLSLTDG